MELATKPPRRRLHHIHGKVKHNDMVSHNTVIVLMDEIGLNWQRIFSFAGLASTMQTNAVSKRFRAIVQVHLANREGLCLSVQKLNHGSDAQLINVLSRCSWLKQLDMRDCIYATDNLLFKLTCSCPNIESVDISGCPRLTPNALVHIGELRSLTTLALNYSFLNCDRFEVIQNVSKNNNALLHLHMNSCKIVSRGHFWYLVVDSKDHVEKKTINHCLSALCIAQPSLKTLSLTGSMDLSYKGLRALSMSTTYHSSLLTLDISFCLLPCECAAAVFESLCHLKNLQCLNLRASFDMQSYTKTGKGLKFFLEAESIEALSSLVNIRRLDVRRLPVWNGPAAYSRIFHSMTLLEALKCDWVPSDTTFQSLNSLPNLSTLKLCWADTLQDRRRSRKIKAISEDAMACLAAPNAYTLTSITSLSLGAGSGLTTSSLATCLTAFTQLKKLKLNEAYTTTDDAFENFQEGKGIVFLKIPGDVRGYLVRIDVLTEKFLRTSFFLHKRIPTAIKLQDGTFVNVLKNGLHSQIAPEQKIEISPSCLKRLGVRKYSPPANIVLVPGSSALVIDFWRMHSAASALCDIKLSKCRFITDRSVKIILSRCPQIRKVSLSSLPNVSDDLIPDMRQYKQRKESKLYSATGRVVQPVQAVRQKEKYNGLLLSEDMQIDHTLRQQLEVLEICDCKGITEKTAAKLAAKPLDSMRKILLHDLANWPLAATPLLCAACTRLEAVDISNIPFSDGSLQKICKTCPTVTYFQVSNIQSGRPRFTGNGAARAVTGGRITHFLSDSDTIRKCIEEANPRVVVDNLGRTGSNQRNCMHVPLAINGGRKKESSISSLDYHIRSKDQSYSVDNETDVLEDAALEDALSDKVSLSDQITWKKDLHLLKKRMKR